METTQKTETPCEMSKPRKEGRRGGGEQGAGLPLLRVLRAHTQRQVSTLIPERCLRSMKIPGYHQEPPSLTPAQGKRSRQRELWGPRHDRQGTPGGPVAGTAFPEGWWRGLLFHWYGGRWGGGGRVACG